jgi:predicted membrane chloride channel (bestrophin family)
MSHFLIPETARVAPLIANATPIDQVVQIVCALQEAMSHCVVDAADPQLQATIHDWTGMVISHQQLMRGIAAYVANREWWHDTQGLARCNMLQLLFIDAELAKLNARRGEVRNQLADFVAQHGSLTIAGVATVRMMEKLTKVSYDAKQVDQVMATLFAAGHNSFAQTLEGCRKQTNVPAHIQIKRAKSAYA